MLVRIESDVPDGCSLVHGFWGGNRLPDDRGSRGLDFWTRRFHGFHDFLPCWRNWYTRSIQNRLPCGMRVRFPCGALPLPFLIKDGSRSSRRPRFASRYTCVLVGCARRGFSDHRLRSPTGRGAAFRSRLLWVRIPSKARRRHKPIWKRIGIHTVGWQTTRETRPVWGRPVISRGMFSPFYACDTSQASRPGDPCSLFL